MPAILDRYAAGDLPLDLLVSRTYRLDEINEAFHDMLAGELARGVIDLSDPHG
jgi:S-(hydroxymethyl)glutathione dehydrogenase/alcohol dehydrogenase